MKYTIGYFSKGRLIKSTTVEAKSHKEALNTVGMIYCTNVVVVGKTVRRYLYDGKKFDGEASFHKCQTMDNFQIMALVGTYAELYDFKSKDIRDEKYKEVECILSTHAESASQDKEQTDTTALSKETSVSKNGLTSPRTLSGSVMSAICKVLLIPSSIEKSSGKDNAENSEYSAWSAGSSPYHSKRNKKIFANFKPIEEVREYISDGEHSASHVFEAFRGIQELTQTSENWYKFGAYVVHKSWITIPEQITAIVTGKVGYETNQCSFVESMKKYEGKILTLKKGYDDYTYTNGMWNFQTEWLEIVEPDGLTGKKMLVMSSIKKWVSYNPAGMDKFVGKILTVKNSHLNGEVCSVLENDYWWETKSLKEVSENKSYIVLPSIKRWAAFVTGMEKYIGRKVTFKGVAVGDAIYVNENALCWSINHLEEIRDEPTILLAKYPSKKHAIIVDSEL